MRWFCALRSRNAMKRPDKKITVALIQQHMQEKQTRDGKSPKIQTFHTALYRENAGAIIPH